MNTSSTDTQAANRDLNAATGLVEMRFSSRSEFVSHLDQTVQLATRQLDVFDPDFADWKWNRPEVFEWLKQLCLSSRTNKIRLICHDGGLLSSQAPRFSQLLRMYNHVIECRHTSDLQKQVQESLLIADHMHAVRRHDLRFHRGQVVHNGPDQIQDWADRFEEIWQQGIPGLSATTLGLGA